MKVTIEIPGVSVIDQADSDSSLLRLNRNGRYYILPPGAVIVSIVQHEDEAPPPALTQERFAHGTARYRDENWAEAVANGWVPRT